MISDNTRVKASIHHGGLDASVDAGRRQILKSVAGAGLLLLLPMLPAYAEAAGQWTSVGPASQFALNVPTRVALKGGGVLFVTRQSPKALVAVSAKCTHRGCEIGWTAPDKQFECPCHGAAFTSDGKNVKGTRRTPDSLLPNLPSVPAREFKGQVQVNLSNLQPEVLEPRQG